MSADSNGHGHNSTVKSKYIREGRGISQTLGAGL